MAEPLGSKIGSAFIEVGASFAGFGKGLAADVTNAFLAQSYVVGQALENFGQAVFTRFSLPLIAATGANIAQFQALDREIRTVLTLFGTADSLVQDTFGEMAAGVRDVSIEVGGLEKDISEGLYQAISAGIPRGGVFEFLDVAQMAAIADRTADLTTSVDGLTTVINAFGLESSEATRIADVMFQTVALGKTTFGELSSDIGRVAPLAANAGVAFEELFAIIGTLTLGGLKTSEAISFLRASITGVLRPTEELNAVFQELGFQSAEAAIPVLGLQGAFQAVVDAAGGSTSELQELIGTSEGVSAILGVTGDNADKFARTMGGVENSTGAATRAFEIMDESVGRSFGRLTESFDRLGNTFGEMASGFAQPLVDAATDVINRVVDIFSNFRPIVEGLGAAFGTLVGLFNLPVLREVAAVLAVIGTSVFGLIGSLGLLSLTLGKVIIAGLQLSTVSTVIKGLGVIFDTVRVGALILGDSLVGVANSLKGMGVAGKFAARPIGVLGKAFQSTRFATLAAGTAFLGVTAIIAGVVAGIGYLITKTKEFNEAQSQFGKGADKLAESLGFVNQEMQLPGIDSAIAGVGEFRLQNADLVQSLKQTQQELGSLAAQQVLESIVIGLVWKGNTPEDVLAELETIEKATGIQIDIDASDFEDATTQLEIFAEGVEAAAQTIGGPRGLNATALNTAEGLVELFKASVQAGDAETFVNTLNTIREDLGETSPEAVQLSRALDSIFERELDANLFNDFFGSNVTDVLDPEELQRRIEEATGIEIRPIEVPLHPQFPQDGEGLGIPEQEIPTFLQGLDDAEIAAAEETAREFGFTLEEVVRIGDDGVNAYRNLADGIEGAFEEAKTSVIDATTEIREQIQSQNPLLDIYSGHVKQSFDEWSEGQQRFRDELEDVTNLRERLVGDKSIPEAVLEAFDAAPLSKQAWLAHLSPENLDAALEELTLTQEAIDEAGTQRVSQSITDIFEEVNRELQTKYGELATQAAEEGPIVANRFNEEYDRAAQQWETTTDSWIRAIITKMENAVIPGPTVGPVQFSGGTFGGAGNITYNNSTTINNPSTESPESSAERVSAINATHNLSPGPN